MIASITALTPKSECVICDRDAECFEADFGKLKGQFCRACFFKLLRSRSAKKEARPREDQAPAPNVQQTPRLK